MKQLNQNKMRLSLFKGMFLLTILWTGFKANAQGCEMISNGGFETHTACPVQVVTSDPATSTVNMAPPWYQPTYGSADYYHTCSTVDYLRPGANNIMGSQPTHNGDGFMGLYATPYEYIQAPLKCALVSGRKYHFSMWVILASKSTFAVNKLGVYFTNGAITTSNDDQIVATAQILSSSVLSDKTNWVQIAGDIIGNGQTHLTIGLFDPNFTKVTAALPNERQGAYYFIDDVSLTAVDPTITATGTTVCPVSPTVTLTASGGTSYLWSNGATTASITVSPTATTTYSVTIGVPANCSCNPVTATVTVTYTSCCGGGYELPTILSSNPPAVNLHTISQDVTVTGNVTFSNTSIQIDPGRKIIVATGGVLTISNSHLYACTDLWDGIYLAGGQVIVNNNSLIEDAANAIVSNNGSNFTINTAIFNKDVIGIKVNAFSGNHPGTVLNSVFTSRKLFITGTWPSVSTLKTAATSQVAPAKKVSDYQAATLIGGSYSNNDNPEKRMYKGIEITSVGTASLNLNANPPTIASTGGINIGAGIDAAQLNLFDNAAYGVYATNSNITVMNNQFQNITNYTGQCVAYYDMNGNYYEICPSTRAAIFAQNTSVTEAGTSSNTANVGDFNCNGSQKNTFFQCSNGGYFLNYGQVNFLSNDVSNFGNLNVGAGAKRPAGDYGLYCSSKISAGVSAAYNSFKNIVNGISVEHAWLGTIKLVAGPVNITLNSFYGNTQPTDQIATGVRISQAYCSNCNGSSVYGGLVQWNGFSGVINGIDLSGLNSKNQTATIPVYAVRDNTLTLKSTNSIGIKVDNCYRADIGRNSISGISGLDYTNQIFMYGIYLNANPGSNTLYCNSITSIGQCIRIQAANPNTNLYGNAMDYANDGLVFKNAPVIGAQGNTNYSNRNVWGDPTHFKRSQTYADNSPNVNTGNTFWVKQNTTGSPTLNLTNSGSALAPQFISASGTLYPACTPNYPYACAGNQPGGAGAFATKMQEVAVEEELISIYPNPNQGTFTVKIPNGETRVVEVYNPLGARVYQSALNDNSIVEIHEPAGIYIVKTIKPDGSTELNKIVIE